MFDRFGNAIAQDGTLRCGLVVSDAMMRLGAIGPHVFRLHGEGRYAEALSVVEDAIDQLPDDDRPTATFWRICLLGRTEQLQAAIVELDSALSRGWWYGEELLRTDDDLTLLQGDSGWEPLVTSRCDGRRPPRTLLP